MILKNTRRRAFTFLEIMFVVVIIGVLLAVAVPRFTGQSAKAKKKATELQIRNIGLALKQYEMHVGKFPETNQGLDALINKPSNVAEDQWEGPYLDADDNPIDAWNNEFNYAKDENLHRDFAIWSSGENGRDEKGGGDDIANFKVD